MKEAIKKKQLHRTISNMHFMISRHLLKIHHIDKSFLKAAHHLWNVFSKVL